jgi:dihydrofolate reductase
MRKLFWQMSVTLDGFMEGPNRELNDAAQVVDEDFDRYATEMLKSIDAILLGRRTYQLFAYYWPSAIGPDADRLNGRTPGWSQNLVAAFYGYFVVQ